MSNYELGEKIGQGGMGVVYRAHHLGLDMDVAVKFIHAHLVEDEEAVRRFLQEARLAARIRHANVVQIYDTGKDEEGRPYIVMEYLEGESLKQRLKRGTVSEPEAVEIANQVLLALEEAHVQGVVHRDIKPGNIFLAKGGKVKLLDFGIAKALGGASLTGTGAMIGTPEYMSPEQAEGKPVDHRTDLYSLGIVLYEMLTGDVPFRADTPVQVLRLHADSECVIPDSMSSLSNAKLRSLLQKDPANRTVSLERSSSSWTPPLENQEAQEKSLRSTADHHGVRVSVKPCEPTAIGKALRWTAVAYTVACLLLVILVSGGYYFNWFAEAWGLGWTVPYAAVGVVFVVGIGFEVVARVRRKRMAGRRLQSPAPFGKEGNLLRIAKVSVGVAGIVIYGVALTDLLNRGRVNGVDGVVAPMVVGASLSIALWRRRWILGPTACLLGVVPFTVMQARAGSRDLSRAKFRVQAFDSGSGIRLRTFWADERPGEISIPFDSSRWTSMDPGLRRLALLGTETGGPMEAEALLNILLGNRNGSFSVLFRRDGEYWYKPVAAWGDFAVVQLEDLVDSSMPSDGPVKVWLRLGAFPNVAGKWEFRTVLRGLGEAKWLLSDIALPGSTWSGSRFPVPRSVGDYWDAEPWYRLDEPVASVHGKCLEAEIRYVAQDSPGTERPPWRVLLSVNVWPKELGGVNANPTQAFAWGMPLKEESMRSPAIEEPYASDQGNAGDNWK